MKDGSSTKTFAHSYSEDHSWMSGSRLFDLDSVSEGLLKKQAQVFSKFKLQNENNSDPLTEEEITEYRKIFQDKDVTGKGTIKIGQNFDEQKKFLKSLGQENLSDE